MKWLKSRYVFLENKNLFLPQTPTDLVPQNKYNSKNLISEICVGMLLLNNNFLDDLLDKGMKARYSENSQVFLSDLKTMLLNKNRLQLGKFTGDICVVDDDTSKITNMFDSIDFEIERDWNVLIDARIYARNICDKILQDDKLTPEMIKTVYWVGLSENKIYPEDLVIELESGNQLGLVLNKSMSQKSTSFNTFGDEILGVDLDGLYKGEYLGEWNKLVQNWVRIIFDNAHKNYKIHIEKFIEPDRIDSLNYFEFFDIKHKDIRFKNIGEHIKEFDKNILKLEDLLNEIWKNKEMCFSNPKRVTEEWLEKKIFLLNSKILEHLFTESLLKNYPNQISKLEDGYKSTDGNVKMRLLKILVEKMGCMERPLYYFSSKGNNWDFVPSRDLFRKLYDDLDLTFDYHVKMVMDTEDEKENDFKMKMKLSLDGDNLLDVIIKVGFSGGEFTNKLSSKFQFEPNYNFNTILITKSNKLMNED